MADFMESLAGRVRSITEATNGVSASNSFRDTPECERNDELAAFADRSDGSQKQPGSEEPSSLAKQQRLQAFAGGGIPAPRATKPADMGIPEHPTRMVSLRLCESDYQLLQKACRENGVDRSTMIRQLIRIHTVLADEGIWGYAEGLTSSAERVIIVDRIAIMQASRELTRWGNHYNQAVHALNTIALRFMRGHVVNEQWLTEQIQEARLQLEDVQQCRESILVALDRIATFPAVKGR